ncbi:MAG: DHH family phosphoesterase [Nanoarchaeota archaeon]
MDGLEKHRGIFFSYLRSIGKNEKIGIVAHGKCNDGMISSIFLTEILKKLDYSEKPLLIFADYGLNVFDELGEKFKYERINKVFVLDLCINPEIAEQFKKFCSDFNVCYIDHHPSDADISFVKNIIKTESADCTSLDVYKLGNDVLNKKYFNELLCAAMVSEFSFDKPENLRLLQEYYPDITKENVRMNSKPFLLSNKIGSVVLYYKDESLRAFDIVSNMESNEINKIHEIITDELEKLVNSFNKAESHFGGRLFFYKIHSRFAIDSMISTILSTRHTNSAIIVFLDHDKDKSLIKISARFQAEPLPFLMNDMLKFGINGLENATAGGHARASGATIRKKDIDQFKKQVISFVNSGIN